MVEHAADDDLPVVERAAEDDEDSAGTPRRKEGPGRKSNLDRRVGMVQEVRQALV